MENRAVFCLTRNRKILNDSIVTVYHYMRIMRISAWSMATCILMTLCFCGKDVQVCVQAGMDTGH